MIEIVYQSSRLGQLTKLQLDIAWQYTLGELLTIEKQLTFNTWTTWLREILKYFKFNGIIFTRVFQACVKLFMSRVNLS